MIEPDLDRFSRRLWGGRPDRKNTLVEEEMSMIKMTEAEARQYVEGVTGDWEDRSEYVRECPECGMWVHVDDFCGGEDRCDDCE